MEEEVQPPFWQPPATITWRSVRRRPVLHSSLVIIIVPSLSLLFIVFILLPSITPKIIPKPNSPLNSKAVSDKRSWDSVNIVLVVFAILCGVFARQNDDAPTPDNQAERVNGGGGAVLQGGGKSERRSGSSAPQCGGYAEQRIYSPTSTPVTGISRLRRTVSEMPPAQQQYAWDAGNDRLRFFDDFEITKFYQSNHHPHHHYQFVFPEMTRIEPENNRVEPNDNRAEPDGECGSVKGIPVDTFVLETRGELPSPSITPPPSPRSSAPHAPPPTPPPPPPPPPSLSSQRTFHTSRRRAAPHSPPPENRSRPRRTFQSTHREERPNHGPPPPPPPPPPPAPTPPLTQGGWGEKKKRSSRKRMNATKEIATAIASFYNHRKRKRKQKQKSNSNCEDHTSPPSMVERKPPPAPPPPPPPPPPSVFHSLFRKGSNNKSKSKKVHSLSSTMPAPPPPPPRPPHSGRKPPLPPRVIIDLFDREESLPKSGNQSPLTPIPPPPPPRLPRMRHGGYDRVQWEEVPEAEREELRSGEMDGGDEETETESVSVSSATTVPACPSPDVNAKADTFIARLHHGWKLEKLNSWREKHNDMFVVTMLAERSEGKSILEQV
ncbi:hypothetical protein Cgig2_030312 [Carnegiea gigantea]|uniref:Uncharacterized protein n=1 Tax=Carnegiea gigantea TaxID=171969 RepID=A0A9Q1JX66_9CARY|nr:hypothetical protein Cgig2_030312 [Carnegiea gigantea]